MTAQRVFSTAEAMPIGEIATPQAAPVREPMLGFRIGLQVAFRRLGVSFADPDAYARTTGFYRRSGAAWTHALRR